MKGNRESERKHHELKESIFAYLQKTSFTEPQLAELHKVDTRTIRKAIGELVAEGQPIVNLGRGFFLSTDPEIIEAAAKRLESHGVNILIRAANLRKIHPIKYLKQLAMDFKNN
jgi:DNA-binding GntR family transcriptional regulator